MAGKQTTFYEVLVWVAYGFYILLGLTITVASGVFGRLNYEALAAALIFCVQAWYKHKLTNLLLGVPVLALSIYWTLEFVSIGQKGGFDLFANVMLSLSAISVIMSGILIFSYTKLSFKDQP